MPRPEAPSARLTAARLRAIGASLDGVRARCDIESRRNNDPVEFVHRYSGADDRELVALIASSLAFGNVKALRAKIDDALTRLGPEIATIADDPAEVARRLRGWKHRVYRDEHLTGLLVGARRVQRRSGSLGQALAAELQRTGDLRLALSAWAAAIRREGGLWGESRGAGHILADPAKGSAVKRLMLLLRWMIRPADGVDLGLWDIPTSRLLIPVDTHIHKLSKNLGLTRRNDVSWRTAEEITAALRRLDPDDPVKYDFSLCHLGMLQHCPSRRDSVRCEGCGVRSVCRHWALPAD
ncbi:MAG: TIGR02757 family protein [Byssovorax sp.]